MKRFFGLLMLLMGISFGGWLLYARMSGRVKDHNPLAGIGLVIGLIIVGARWVRGSGADNGSGSTGKDAPALQASRRSSNPVDLNLSNFTLSGWCLLIS